MTRKWPACAAALDGVHGEYRRADERRRNGRGRLRPLGGHPVQARCCNTRTDRPILELVTAAGFTVTDRMDVIAEPWQAHVVYRDMLADTGRRDMRDLPAYIDAAYAGKPVTLALAHGEPGIHARLRQLIGHTDSTRAVAGTVRGDLGDDSMAVARKENRLVRNLEHTSNDPEGARREPGRRLQINDFDRCSVVLCKPDAVARTGR